MLCCAFVACKSVYHNQPLSLIVILMHLVLLLVLITYLIPGMQSLRLHFILIIPPLTIKLDEECYMIVIGVIGLDPCPLDNIVQLCELHHACRFAKFCNAIWRLLYSCVTKVQKQFDVGNFSVTVSCSLFVEALQILYEIVQLC
jgi:hypothetical protein